MVPSHGLVRASKAERHVSRGGRIACAGLALGGLVALTLLLGREARDADLALRPASAQQDPASDPTPLAARGDATPAARAPAPPLAPLPRDEPPRAAPLLDWDTPPRTVRVRGRAIAVLPSGEERREEDGRVVIVLSRDNEPVGERELAVRAGRFELEARAGDFLFVQELELGGRVLLVEPDQGPVHDGLRERELEVRGHVVRAATLHVVDAQTRAHLDGVDVFAAGPYYHDQRAIHPGAPPAGPPLVAGARSPLDLPAPPRLLGRPAQSFWVRAPDHAYALAVIDHEHGGEHTVALERAGALDVELAGYDPALRAVLRLERDGEDPGLWDYPDVERAAEGERVSFDALPPGWYRARLELGWMEAAIVLGETRTEVAAGRRTAALIGVSADAPARDVPFEGVVVVPPSWGEPPLELRFVARGATKSWTGTSVAQPAVRHAVGGAGRERPFALELPFAGAWEVVVAPPDWRASFDVGAAGLRSARIELPEAALVELRPVDADTNELADVDVLHWNGPRLEGTEGWVSRTLVAQDGVFRWVAPAGELEIALRGERWELVHPYAPLVVLPGQNELELDVRRRTGARFVFVDGVTVVPWSWDWRLGARHVESGAHDIARSIDHLWFGEPGRYALSSRGPIEGYAPIDGFELDVRRGEVVRVVVPLLREE